MHIPNSVGMFISILFFMQLVAMEELISNKTIIYESPHINKIRYALQQKNILQFNCLLKKNSCKTYVDHKGCTLLHWVVKAEIHHFKSAQKCIQENKPFSSLIQLLAKTYTDTYKYMLNLQDNKGNTPLHYAIKKHAVTQHWHLIKMLIVDGADVYLMNKKEYCPALKLLSLEPHFFNEWKECLSSFNTIIIPDTNQNILHILSAKKKVLMQNGVHINDHPFIKNYDIIAGFLMVEKNVPFDSVDIYGNTALLPHYGQPLPETAQEKKSAYLKVKYMHIKVVSHLDLKKNSLK